MLSRIVLASRRFQKDYPDFLRKYTDLEPTFREFLQFRADHRPDEPFGSKDSRMTGSKFHRCHLIHGKAIVIYQLHGREIRLVAMEEHNAVEGGTNRPIRRYADSLTQEDYYLFDVDHPVAIKPVIEEQMEQVAAAPEVETPNEPAQSAEPLPIKPVSEPVLPIKPVSEPVRDNPLWNDRVVSFLRDRQMLVVPRPSREMIAITLDKELIAPRGDVLLIDPTGPTIYHLTQNEYEAHFQPAPNKTTSLSEALSTVMAQPEPNLPEPNLPESLAPQPHPRKAAERVRHDIAPQLGRLLVMMDYLQRQNRTTKIDVMTLRDHLHERDIRSLSPVMSTAQSKALIRKSGNKKGQGRAFYYCLTPIGEQKARTLGDWPFTVAGLRPPFTEDHHAVTGQG